ncbi:hypothetical protein MBLNU230_g4268t1 [Neophaeotheca triangularis]
MHSTTLFTAALFSGLALAAPAPAPRPQLSQRDNHTPAPNADLLNQLQLAPVATDRIALLADSDFKFDFQSPPTGATTSGKGGSTVRADRATFPALIGTGVGMTVGFIGPCGFNTPHTHPRSSEINLIVQGKLATEFQAENGARVVTDELSKFQMTVFPQGALHTEFNPDCEDAVFVAGFASEDPGVLQAAQSLFGLGEDVVKAALAVDAFNGADLDEFRQLIPANVALGVEQCLAKCGIAKSYRGE